MKAAFYPGVILAKRESSVILHAQHINDTSLWLTQWIPAVARMTAESCEVTR